MGWDFPLELQMGGERSVHGGWHKEALPLGFFGRQLGRQRLLTDDPNAKKCRWKKQLEALGDDLTMWIDIKTRRGGKGLTMWGCLPLLEASSSNK